MILYENIRAIYIKENKKQINKRLTLLPPVEIPPVPRQRNHTF